MDLSIMNNLHFRQAIRADQDLILSWHYKPHVQEFWDTSQRQITNVINYLNGKRDLFDYWIGSIDGIPFCLVMTSDFQENTPQHVAAYLSKTGRTWSIDFMIGNEEFLGKGLAASTLQAFADFLQSKWPDIDRLLIDPAADNTKAVHVYKKAGFVTVGEFTPSEGTFKGIKHYLMIKDLTT